MKNEQFDKLSAEGRRLYRRVRREWRIGEEPALTTLLTACQALDRMREAQAAIATEGLIVLDRFQQQQPHPLLRLEKESRAHMLQCFKALQLDLDSLLEVSDAKA
jgi:P27 family predicted phage terminase small subunit